MTNRRNFIAGIGTLVAGIAAGAFSLPIPAAVPEIELRMVSAPVVAKVRKLKAVWTCELEQDLCAYHSIKAEMDLAEALRFYDPNVYK